MSDQEQYTEAATTLERGVPFCSEELNELMNEFVSILGEFGMTEIDDVIDTAIVRCGVKKSRREHARRLIETAFDVLLEIKGVGQSNINAALTRGAEVVEKSGGM